MWVRLVMSVVTGVLVLTPSLAAQESDGYIEWPIQYSAGDVALSPDGSSVHIVATSPWTRGEGDHILQIDQEGVVVGTVAVPAVRQIAVESDGSLLLLAGNELLRVSPEGAILNRWDGWDEGRDVAVGPDGAIYISVGGRGVVRLDRDGREIAVLGDNEIGEPDALAVDRNGRVYASWVAGNGQLSDHSLIYVFNDGTSTDTADDVVELASFEPVRAFVVIGEAETRRVAVASVEDVALFEMNGEFVRSISSGIWDIDRKPGGIAADSCGTLYTTKQGSPDAQMFVVKTFPAERSAGCFLDTTHSIFLSDIAWFGEQGITRGCNPSQGGDRFCPSSNVTRAQMAAFLSRALSLAVVSDDPFVDDDQSVFEQDIEKLYAAGITRGCNPPANDRFCPDENVTRGEMAAFLTRAGGPVDEGGGDWFVDDDNSVFERDIDRLAAAGITKGCNPPANDRFCPDAFVTRGQMAALIHRMLGWG